MELQPAHGNVGANVSVGAGFLLGLWERKTYPGRWSDALVACAPAQCFLCMCPGHRWNSTLGWLRLARAASRCVTIGERIMGSTFVGVYFAIFSGVQFPAVAQPLPVSSHELDFLF